jgi:signal transduction histidine kinase
MLRAALAAAVGDPTLEVSFPLAGSRYVGADGRRVDAPSTEDGRAATPIVREGRVLAVVTHDAALLEGAQVERQIGSATRLAVENERLQAEVLARLVELRASRSRIVERGDDERRRLERNLHDGAQQRLLALAYDLRIARSSAAKGGEDDVERLLRHAVEESHVALEELRGLARGIFPAILAEEGLGAAIASLADEAPIPVEPGDVTGERFLPAIETAVYLTIAEAVDDAASRHATHVAIDVVKAEDRLVVAARDDGTPRHVRTVRAGDRIGALGGTVDVGPTSLHAEIPCA